jgi:OOP family OmpA-OmpF porin
MHSKALLTLLAFGAYAIGATWYYTCRIKGFCGEDPTPVATAPTVAETAATEPALSLSDPVMFLWDSPKPYLRSDFDRLRDSLAKLATGGHLLTVTGFHFEGESRPDSFPDMGMARAEALKQLLAPKIGQIRTASREGRFYAEYKTDPFWGCDFSVARPSVYATESADSIVVFFPTGAQEKTRAAELENALSKIAKRLAGQTFRLKVTGLYDLRGDESRQRRSAETLAGDVAKLLTKKGVASKRLTVKTLGTPPGESGSGQRVVVRILR